MKTSIEIKCELKKLLNSFIKSVDKKDYYKLIDYLNSCTDTENEGILMLALVELLKSRDKLDRFLARFIIISCEGKMKQLIPSLHDLLSTTPKGTLQHVDVLITLLSLEDESVFGYVQSYIKDFHNKPETVELIKYLLIIGESEYKAVCAGHFKKLMESGIQKDKLESSFYSFYTIATQLNKQDCFFRMVDGLNPPEKYKPVTEKILNQYKYSNHRAISNCEVPS